jgi:hypothetical protein
MAKQSQSWKNLERKTAQLLGGIRYLRGSDFSKSAPDVILPDLSPECKYRQNAPMYYYDHINVLKDEDKYTIIYHNARVALKLSVFAKIYKGDIKPILAYYVPGNKKYSKFLEDALEQSAKYDLNKIPLVVYKRERVVDEIVYMIKDDFQKIYDKVYWEAYVKDLKVRSAPL